MEVYLLIKRCVSVTETKVSLGQVAEILCREENIRQDLQLLTIGDLQKQTRAVYSALYLVEQVQTKLPDAKVFVLGETEVIVELAKPAKGNPLGATCKIILVTMVTFFGTAFTIMAYHNDIGITRLFREVYHLLTNEYPGGITVLEIGYSVGLAAGILIFYNHIGTRKLTSDPTPMEVSMQEYERSVNDTLVTLADRQGTEEALK